MKKSYLILANGCRYHWCLRWCVCLRDAWNRLGDLSPESAMAMYVEEMKKVAQEVIDTMPMNHTTASFFHHFEPLYSVIGDMPRPPASLLTHVAGRSAHTHSCLAFIVRTIIYFHSFYIMLSIWSTGPAPTGEPRQAPQGGAGGSGQRGGDGSEGRAERLHDAYLQQQVILALRRLREDMGSVMERLEVVERLAASHWRTCLQCAASQQEESWWPFDMSGPTVLLFLLWPFVAQGLVYMLKKAHQKGRTSL
uniref:Acyl-CoA binding domain containing 4 n=1 Tax=Nothobranchius furzeri TaxID=105023 RepID=A0A8C6NWA8_NOTFU